MYGAFSVVIAVLMVLLVILLIFRELACWYWKINESVSLLRSIDAKLSVLSPGAAAGILKPASVNAIPTQTDKAGTLAKPVVPDRPAERVTCPFCKELTAKNKATCENCGNVR
ncbi:MAG: hypothetical protein JW937_01605 [Candidatus Omnitrophica bacterium]|nr:hypothetical protein [Candidatus Omnitrophota bacterium]